MGELLPDTETQETEECVSGGVAERSGARGLMSGEEKKADARIVGAIASKAATSPALANLAPLPIIKHRQASLDDGSEITEAGERESRASGSQGIVSPPSSFSAAPNLPNLKDMFLDRDAKLFEAARKRFKGASMRRRLGPRSQDC